MVEEPKTADSRRVTQLAEYGTYVATEPIYHEGALAFDTDHPVPVSHVERWRKEGDDRHRSVKPVKES